MEHTWLLHNLIVALGLLEECSAFPIHLGAGGLWSAGVASPLTAIALGAATLLAAAALLLGCVCCRQQKGFQDKACMQDGSCKQNGTTVREQIHKPSVSLEKDIAKQDVSVTQNSACNSKELNGVVFVKEFTDSVVSSQNNLAQGSSSAQNSGLTNHAVSELTLFPPLGAALAQPGDRSSIVHFEPLPDIHVVAAAAAARRKPAVFGSSLHHGLSVREWFEEPVDNFPRDQLQYLRELGRGWFGRVVEGNAKEIILGRSTSKVIVKILHEDATPTDQSYFLHEANAYRCLKHPNVLRLVGRCLETHPFLLLLEDCSSGTLKTFLTENKATAEKLSQQGVLLEMALGVAAGLQHMVENGFVHTDLAARNCLVTSDLTVKVGDYGISIETFKDEYHCVGDLAIPIRWVAPETLHCTDTTIETKEVTASANVWSLSIVLWEICELGKLPYVNLSDEEVIVQVLGNRSVCLPFPSNESQPHIHNLYHLMKICWVEAEKRPSLERVVAMLQHLLQHKNSPAHTSANNNNNSTTSLDDFERRWELSKPNTVPKIDNQQGSASVQSSPIKAALLQRCASMEENVGTAPVPPLQLSVNTSADRANASSSANSPQLSLSSSLGGEIFALPSLANQKSPSLQNLRGSVDELNIVDKESVKEDTPKPVMEAREAVTEETDFDSWLKGMDTTTEEDVRFVRNISEAIRDLDEVLAQEKTSSSSQSSSAQPSPSQVTSRDSKQDLHMYLSQDQKFTLDFRLGQAAAPSLLSRGMGLLHSSGHDSLSLSQHRLESSGSDTEDETWRIRIERGEFSEKVKEKSKSVADLMVLTHIEYSDGSDSDTTLDFDPRVSAFKINGVGRRSFHRKPLQSSLSVAYGSEGNIHQAVLVEEFQETIKRLQESLRDGSKLEAIPDASLSCLSTSSNEATDSLHQTQIHSNTSHFLAKLASEKKNMKNDIKTSVLSGFKPLDSDEEVGTAQVEAQEEMKSRQISQDMGLLDVKGNFVSVTGVSDYSSQMLQIDPNQTSTSDKSFSKCEDINAKSVCEVTDDCATIMTDSRPVQSSTPVPGDCKLTPIEADSFDEDSSLLRSQTLSFIDSERNFSTSSPEKRPLTPTPGDSGLKTDDSSCVFLGPFEDSTLDYFKGLKTSFPAARSLEYDTSQEIDLGENSIETWDKFLDHAMQPVNDYPSFSDVSFTKIESESESPMNNSNSSSCSSDILGTSFRGGDQEVAAMSNISLPVEEKVIMLPSVKVSCDENFSQNADDESQRIAPAASTFNCHTKSSTMNMKNDVKSSLVVPSVNVIGATPISSGRSSPNELTNQGMGLIHSMSEESPNLNFNNLYKEDEKVVDHKSFREHGVEASQNLFEKSSNNITVGFVVPQFDKTEFSRTFDPDLPCCDQSKQNFLSSGKTYNVMNNEFDMFSNNATYLENESAASRFDHELVSDCFINPSLSQDIVGKGYKPVLQIFSKVFDSKDGDQNGAINEEEDEFALGVAKNLTPDDERSSDSGFRDKGSLSESCEDACDEKYNLEDIEAELEEAFSKGVFARHDSPTSNKGMESDCDIADETFSVTLTDVEKQREQREAEISRSEDPCLRLDVLLRGDAAHEPLSADVKPSGDFFGASPALSPIPQSSGWFLHPPQNNEEASTEPISGNDSSYFSLNLDEEFVNAIRNELREKLPFAQQQREDNHPQLSDEEGQSDEETDSDSSPSRERTNIMIQYKTYPAPLSPILEERESICSESCSPLSGYNTSSGSEQLSPVFAVDQCFSNQGDGSAFQIDDDVQHVESECPAEVDGDLSDDCGDCILFDDFGEQDACAGDAKIHDTSSLEHFTKVNNLYLNGNGAEDDDEDDDLLVINTETNEATLLESPKSVMKSASNEECDDASQDDFVPNFLSVAGSYQLPEIKFNKVEQMHPSLYKSHKPLTLVSVQQKSDETESGDENNENAMTPDSIDCETSFSERTEDDSAVGLAPSEVMTPDSLTEEGLWTSAQMCDSGFGTFSSKLSCGKTIENSEKSSPEMNEVDWISVEKDSSDIIPKMATRKQDVCDQVEPSETINSTEDSESSISFSSNSVIALSSSVVDVVKDQLSDGTISQVTAPLHPNITNLMDVKADNNFNARHDAQSFLEEEKKFSSLHLSRIGESSPMCQKPSPPSLKEIAKNVLGEEWNSRIQTLAFSSENCLKSNHGMKPHVDCGSSHIALSVESSESASDIKSSSHSLSTLERKESLQTLAFSDPDSTERSNFPGPGHIIVSSVITPLTPSDETVIPGTLAFNESPESACGEAISPLLKETDSTEEAESHLMSTSFMSADDLYDDQDPYLPDWESGSDGCESETASSSSGEFIWKDGERESSVRAVQAAPDSALMSTSDDQAYHQTLPEFPMSSILEEEEDEDGSGSSSCSSDSEDDADFVPSAWDSQATPSRSALRSPDKKVEHKKNVSFKRQRYHCVYEYPRELSDSDGSEFADSPSRRRTWDLECNTSNLHDWELADNEGMAEAPCLEELNDGQLISSPVSQELFQFYKLSNADYVFGSSMVSEDGEFFISSSAQPFHTLGESNASGSSEFFPGRDLTISNVDDNDVVVGFPEESPQPSASEKQDWNRTDESSDTDSSDTNMITASESSFTHQKSGESNSSSAPMFTANGSSKSSDESSLYHSFSTNQELHVDSGSDSLISELSPPSPLSPMSPSHGLGELRHTRDRLKLDLPAPSTTFVLVAPCKKRSVEQVKGEASLLDGEEILEDRSFNKSNNPSCLSESMPVTSNVH